MEEIIIYKVLNDPIFLKMENHFKKIIDLSNMKTEKVKRNEKSMNSIIKNCLYYINKNEF